MFFFSDKALKNINQNTIEQAYFEIINDNLEVAAGIFDALDSPRAKWGSVLIQIIKGYINNYPTYFEIRNFLEIDLDFLIKNKKINYVEQLLGALDLLVGINQEIYKYVARVMFENNYTSVSKKYLDKSKDIFYNDPELHFMYAKYFIKTNDYELADYHLEECLDVLPDYVPAKNLQKEISIYLA